ncbi:hypothetical protein TSOC_004814 [Tetrabaena socialis]|uniref:Uncharacterized protein n=1 Tax=Tetrabaena socialis TaxID=47790 RepID=A0A2J8A7W7_9CHLO|nr:hypothetical protein TSOC_004814 [Tetrabaena socialis]|eukprot:PNH08608.1 hypothetical protein TSOC_004814 [Tetrabaena socialis]
MSTCTRGAGPGALLGRHCRLQADGLTTLDLTRVGGAPPLDCAPVWNHAAEALCVPRWPVARRRLAKCAARAQEDEAAAPSAGPAAPSISGIWAELPTELKYHVLGSLAPNEIACTVRLLSKAAASHFCEPQHRAVLLSKPLPERAMVQHWCTPGAMRALTLRQRGQLLGAAASSGKLGDLQLLVGAAGGTLTVEVFEAAAGAGRLDACRWLHEQGCPFRDTVWLAAARTGRLHICQWLHAEGYRWGIDDSEIGDPLQAAAEAGHQDLCAWLLDNVEHLNRDFAARAAAIGGHEDLMDWLLARVQLTKHDREFLLLGVAAGCSLARLRRHHRTLLDQAGRLQLLDCLQSMALAHAAASRQWREKVAWLLKQGYTRSGEAEAHVVAKCPDDAVERIKWLQAHDFPFSELSPSMAAMAGNLPALEFLLADEAALPDDIDTVRCAAGRGHTAVLAALHARGGDISDRILCTMVINRYNPPKKGLSLPTVRWLLETPGVEEQDLDDVLSDAAESGSLGAGLELLTYLRARGCPWPDEDMFEKLASTVSEEQLEWVAANGCPIDGDGCPFRAACAAGNLDVLDCLQRLGWQHNFGNKTFQSMVNKQAGGPVLRWLLENGCPVDWDTLSSQKANPGVRAWLDRQAAAAKGVV